MRPNPLIPVALALLCACAGSRQSTAATATSPDASPSPLRSCESRELTIDGADVVVQANVDRTPASIVVVRAPDEDARAKAFEDARKDFGDPHPDTRTQTKQFKWGLVQLTDLCGRPVMPASSPTATPSPG